MKRVASLLGFQEMPADLAAHAEYLRDQRASPDFAAESLAEFLNGPPSTTGVRK